MAKAKKKETPKPPKKNQKRIIDVDTNLTFEEALRLAANTPKPKKNKS